MAEAGLFRHTDQGRVVRTIERPDPEAIEAIRSAYSAFLLDRLGKHGAVHHGIKPLAPGWRLCGPAVTALGSDLTVRRMAIDLAQAGDVLVVAAGGLERACFGDGTAARMRLKPMAGAVIDGYVRDASGLRALNWPVFCRGATPRNHHYPSEPLHGAVNVPVVCGGAVIHPGDLLFGDDDGVVVIPRQLCEEVATRLVEAVTEERETRAGWTAYEPFDVEEEMRRRGYHFD